MPASNDQHPVLAAGVELEYAPAPESTAIVSIADSYGLFLDGEFTDASSNKSLVSLNPATEEPLTNVAIANQADVDAAVASSRPIPAIFSSL